MRHRTCRILTLVVALLSISMSVGAQETEETPVYVESELTQTEEKELKKWMDKDQEWKDWCEKWCNKALRHEAITKIRPRPEPPAWLSERCANHLFLVDELLTQACTRLREITEDFKVANVRNEIEAEQKKKEAQERINFLEKIHFGSGWPVIRDVESFNNFALLAVHYSVRTVGRWEANSPGFILLNIANPGEEKKMKFGTYISVGFKWREVRFLGRPYVLHFNMVNAWTSGSVGESLGFQETLSLAGLSITLKK